MSFQEAQAKRQITAECILKEETVLLALATLGPVDTKKKKKLQIRIEIDLAMPMRLEK